MEDIMGAIIVLGSFAAILVCVLYCVYMTGEDRGIRRARKRLKNHRSSQAEMTEEQLVRMFAPAAGDRSFEAILEVIDRKALDLSDEMRDPKQTHPESRFYAGGVDALLTLKADVLDYVKDGQNLVRREQELAAKKERARAEAAAKKADAG